MTCEQIWLPSVFSFVQFSLFEQAVSINHMCRVHRITELWCSYGVDESVWDRLI